jgi:hypothetical protein
MTAATLAPEPHVTPVRQLGRVVASGVDQGTIAAVHVVGAGACVFIMASIGPAISSLAEEGAAHRGPSRCCR